MDLYRVSLNGLIIFQRVIEGPQTNKKLYERGGLKCNPGEIWAKYWFLD